MKKIPVSGPWITPKEISYVTDAVTNAWYGRANEYHEKFEKAFAAYVGRKYAIALPSCTSAIHLALMALGVGEGDEVIVPELTWIATAAPLNYVRAVPVFADVDRETWCLCPDAIEPWITSRTKAIIAVGLYGGTPDYDRLTQMCRRRGIALIEDAAECLGSQFHGKMAGSFGEVSVFSFHGSKTFTTGEGGMLVTDRKDLFDRALFLRDHGRNPGDTTFYSVEVGYKYKMSAMQAALGLAQIERAHEIVERKREIFAWYQKALKGVEGITLNAEPAGTLNSYWMVSIILDSRWEFDKTRFIRAMDEEGVSCRPFFHPLSSLPAYQKTPYVEAAKSRNRVSYALSPYGINLPSGFNLNEETVYSVARTVQKIVLRAASGARRVA